MKHDQRFTSLLTVLLATTLIGCQQNSGLKAPSQQITTSKHDKRLWVSDLQDGRYRNPILHLDYSDPDVVAVNGNYYMTSSSFNAAPGLPILHSTDLVNWELINYALPEQVPASVFATPQHGNGVWAPNFRYHDGKYWIFYPDPDFGVYVTTAADPAGKWSKPKRILAGKGLIDPTPMWDDDGKAYLLHAWAKSRAGFNNVLSLRKMAPDASWVSDQYLNVVNGHELQGYRTIEGPKFYKRNGYYYIFAPAGGVETGWQTVFRSRNIEGPYEHRIVMAQGDTLINGPHQGAWVHTTENEDWFVHFQSRKAYGRIVHLQPMTWNNDWPVIGKDEDGNGVGEPVYEYRKPATTKPGMVKAQLTTDEFNDDTLGIQWQWNANPNRQWYSLSAKPGHIRLFGQQKIEETGDNLWMTSSLMLQKLPAQTFQVRADIALDSSSDNAEGGLLLFGEDYAWIGIKPIDGERHLVYVQCRDARKGCDEFMHDYGPVTAQSIEVRYIMANDATAIFAYRTTTDDNFTVVGEQFKARRGRWVGAKTGLFSLAGKNQDAHLDVDYFHFIPMLRRR